MHSQKLKRGKVKKSQILNKTLGKNSKSGQLKQRYKDGWEATV